MTALLALSACLIELAIGYPEPLFRIAGHPVIWIGRMIAALDRWLNRPRWPGLARRVAGAAALALLVAASGGGALAIGHIAGDRLGLLLVAILGSTLIAQRSLAGHVAAVARALETEGLAAGRRAVARIVGRDSDRLNEAGVARAAIESLAENFSDGVVAPVFWLALGGLPGAAIYKAVNTADSMIGHRTERHRAFGWAAARLDDLINLPASRLTALLLVGAACLLPDASPRAAIGAVWRDAHRHRSPNAGWAEATMAGALGFALAGPRVYGGVRVEDAVMGSGGRRALGPGDIRRALRLYWVADALLLVLLGLACLVTLPG